MVPKNTMNNGDHEDQWCPRTRWIMANTKMVLKNKMNNGDNKDGALLGD